jgi:hypothetical protein
MIMGAKCQQQLMALWVTSLSPGGLGEGRSLCLENAPTDTNFVTMRNTSVQWQAAH